MKSSTLNFVYPELLIISPFDDDPFLRDNCEIVGIRSETISYFTGC